MNSPVSKSSWFRSFLSVWSAEDNFFYDSNTTRLRLIFNYFVLLWFAFLSKFWDSLICDLGLKLTVINSKRSCQRRFKENWIKSSVFISWSCCCLDCVVRWRPVSDAGLSQKTLHTKNTSSYSPHVGAENVPVHFPWHFLSWCFSGNVSVCFTLTSLFLPGSLGSLTNWLFFICIK